MMRQYLVNIALERIDPRSGKDGVPASKIMNIEFRVTTTDIAPAETRSRSCSPTVHIVPWRQVSADAVSFGCPNGSVAP